MRLISPKLPARTRVTGRIVKSDDPRDLGRDMLEVELPGGILVTAGWYPESSPSGSYQVKVLRGLQVVIPPVSTPSADRAAEDVAALVERFSSESAVVHPIEPESCLTEEPRVQ